MHWWRQVEPVEGDEVAAADEGEDDDVHKQLDDDDYNTAKLNHM